MPAGLQFLLFLPDGSKSLIPAEWTDFQKPTGAAELPQLVGSCEDLLEGGQEQVDLLRRAGCDHVPSMLTGAGPNIDQVVLTWIW